MPPRIDLRQATKFVTAGNGSFEFLNVQVGRYRLEASAAGFSTSVSDNFDVTVNARQRVDLMHFRTEAKTLSGLGAIAAAGQKQGDRSANILFAEARVAARFRLMASSLSGWPRP